MTKRTVPRVRSCICLLPYAQALQLVRQVFMALGLGLRNGEGRFTSSEIENNDLQPTYI